MGDTEPDGVEPDGTKRDDASPRSSIPLFDPIAGMRAMADVQADGLRAASELLERMVGHERPDPAPRRAATELNYTAVVEAWSDLLQRIASGMAQPVQSGAVTVAIDSTGGGAPVRLTLDASERDRGTVGSEVWLHNGTDAAVGPLSMRCGQLMAPDGRVLDGAQVQFDPAEVDLLPARSSRGVLVSLVTTGSPPPGIYRSTIQAEGAPKLWLPLEVAIEPC